MTEMVTFKLNNKEVTVPKNYTVMRAAEENGVKIPRFCWHPGLSVAGVCRFCMVKVEGRPKLEIACNLQVAPGMEVRTDTEEVKETHKWALEYHLINHPLDCPYCDQAGECGLQDYYMEVGKYQSQMDRPKVLKPKALDVGSELVLDTERCILCSRCVRFEDEVTKTGGLGIFDRGDRAIIGTHNEEKIDHNYQENLVDICPVGAFTSKKFRFKKRVWFLKEKEGICPGCSTGCKVSVHAQPERRRYERMKPVFDASTNDHWMCDKGRRTFTHLNPEERIERPYHRGPEGQLEKSDIDQVTRELADKISGTSPAGVALLVSAHYTNEEYDALFSYFVEQLKVKNIYQWRQAEENIEAFDGILMRGDHNPNTQGLLASLAKVGIKKSVANEFDACLAQKPEVLIAICPEVKEMFPGFADSLTDLAHNCEFLSAWGLAKDIISHDKIGQVVALKGFMEKVGNFTNYNNDARSLKDPFPAMTTTVYDIGEVVNKLKEQADGSD